MKVKDAEQYVDLLFKIKALETRLKWELSHPQTTRDGHYWCKCVLAPVKAKKDD